MEHIKSLADAIRYFADELVCIHTVAQMRWMDGQPICPHCESPKNYWLANAKRWKCAGCRKQFSVKVGTIFEDSPIKLDKWLTAMWLIANCKNGVSSYEIHRAVGVTQKSAWFMLQRIRFVLAEGGWPKMGGSDSGPVEVDETFIGGKVSNMHKSKRTKVTKAGRGHVNKTIVMGMLDRDSRQVRAKVVPNVERDTLQNEIIAAIEKKSTVYTDKWGGYRSLEEKEFVHDTVNHMVEYVKGQVHTNGIENFWSLLKRSLHGTYVAVEPFHLSKYVDEQIFRFNNRATKDNPLNDRDRFIALLAQVSGKRLTYAELTGKEAETASW